MYHVATQNCCSTEDACSEASGFCMPHHRRFISKAELKEMLEKYKDQLKKEIDGVDEKISKLSKKED